MSTELPTNESLPTEPVKERPDPDGYAAKEKTLDAEHGQEPHPDPTHMGQAAWDAVLEGLPDYLEHSFGGLAKAKKDAKDFIDEHFDTKDYVAREPLLRKLASAGDLPSGETLGEKVKRVLG